MCKILHDSYYSLKDYENSLERFFGRCNISLNVKLGKLNPKFECQHFITQQVDEHDVISLKQ